MKCRTPAPLASPGRLAGALLLAAALGAALPAAAALTDLGSAPLATSSTNSVKPNISFVLDASGSMAWSHAPDEAEPFYNKVGYKTSQCNSIYYRPDIVYVPPKNPDGTDFPNASFTGAWVNGFNQSSGTRNLSTSFIAYDFTTSSGNGTDTPQPAYYYTYSGTQKFDYQNTNSQFYKECTLNESAKPYATITFSGSNSTAVNSITVNGTNIMSGSTASSSSSSTLASLTAALITASGYSATASGSTVTINGPSSAAGVMPVITTTPPLPTATVTFSGSQNSFVGGIKVNGLQIMSSPTSATTSSSTLASRVASGIDQTGYSATSPNSSSTVTITGPIGAAGFTPVVDIEPTNATATIDVNGNGSTSVSSIKVNGVEIMSGATSASSNKNTVASRIDSNITRNGFSASSSGNTVTITGPLSAVGATAVVTKSGGMTFTISAFSANGTMTYSASPFSSSAAMSTTVQAFSPFAKVIVSATSGPGGTDERQNFANWFSYYRTRILMMKSGAGRAFASIGDSYRVGFMTIQATPSTSTTDPEYLMIDDFGTTQKNTWYQKFYAMNPNNATPLKYAYSKAGRNIAGKLGPDPMQYSCQQNFIILTTDGYWNAGSPNPVNVTGGSLSPSSQDSNISKTPRPLYDGALSGASNTLADAAAYYYYTDLRNSTLGNCTSALTGQDVCQDNVPTSPQDNLATQHVTTFTLGLGTNGKLAYASDYLSGGSADYNALVAGSINWPVPVGDTLTTIDDLWHAAVNGHGQYFAAKNPDLLVQGLRTALAGVSQRQASGAAAATSNLEPVAGDNFAYVANYRTVKWDGELQARTIDLNTGAIATTPVWSAQALLDATVSDTSDSRNIFTFLGGVQKPFVPASFSDAQKAAWFTPTNAPSLTQVAGWTAAQVAAATPDTVINYLRGQTGFEERTANATMLYRLRDHVLGDIIDGKPVYVKKPPFEYNDLGYAAFKASLATRRGIVYAAANDGMLHAFDAVSGQEVWAYVPSFVLPNMKALSDDNYANAHQYYVDGSPVASDIYNGSTWKTILVGGLNGGGKGYYALDITDPNNPKVLWEFSDANLGFSYGNPVIGKLSDGTWVVCVTSGYNNVGDGVGRLYVLNADTGAIRFTVSTGVGTATSPSGLAKISGVALDALTDNTIDRIYGGDLLGNLWRFDVNDRFDPPNGAAGRDATKLASFVVSGTPIKPQPVTTAPEIGQFQDSLGETKFIVIVGTGRYLGPTDLSDTSQQSLYAILDGGQFGSPSNVGDIRNAPTCTVVQQSITVLDPTHRSTSANPVDFNADCAWYLDFNPNNDSPGERVNIDPVLQLGVLAVATNVPEESVCTLGGTSWLYFFNFLTGTFVSTSSGNVAGTKIGNSITVGLNTYRLPDNRVITTPTQSDDTRNPYGNPFNPVAAGQGKRVMWRELLE
jgi:type IV pilus assembly protein PilY1